MTKDRIDRDQRRRRTETQRKEGKIKKATKQMHRRSIIPSVDQPASDKLSSSLSTSLARSEASESRLNVGDTRVISSSSLNCVSDPPSKLSCSSWSFCSLPSCSSNLPAAAADEIRRPTIEVWSESMSISCQQNAPADARREFIAMRRSGEEKKQAPLQQDRPTDVPREDILRGDAVLPADVRAYLGSSTDASAEEGSSGTSRAAD